jgi:hypothetical protein
MKGINNSKRERERERDNKAYGGLQPRPKGVEVGEGGTEADDLHVLLKK